MIIRWPKKHVNPMTLNDGRKLVHPIMKNFSHRWSKTSLSKSSLLDNLKPGNPLTRKRVYPIIGSDDLKRVNPVTQKNMSIKWSDDLKRIYPVTKKHVCQMIRWSRNLQRWTEALTGAATPPPPPWTQSVCIAESKNRFLNFEIVIINV